MEFHYANGGRHFIHNNGEGGLAEALRVVQAWPARGPHSRVTIEDADDQQEIELTDVVKIQLEVTA